MFDVYDPLQCVCENTSPRLLLPANCCLRILLSAVEKTIVQEWDCDVSESSDQCVVSKVRDRLCVWIHQLNEESQPRTVVL